MPWCQDGTSALLESCWLAGQAAFLEHPLECSSGILLHCLHRALCKEPRQDTISFQISTQEMTFHFSVLIHRVVKIFRLEAYKLGLAFLWFSFKHLFLVPIQWKRWVACHCSGPAGPAAWLGLLNSIKWSIDSMCHRGCLGRVRSKISVCGWACVLITLPKNCSVQNLAGTHSKEE